MSELIPRRENPDPKRGSPTPILSERAHYQDVVNSISGAGERAESSKKETKEDVDKKTFLDAMRERARQINSVRVEEAVQKRITDFEKKYPNVEKIKSFLMTIENDYFDMVTNPQSASFVAYPGWSTSEIKALYWVLYGEEI